MTAGYDTLIVTFSDPIRILDMMFTDTPTIFRGVCGEIQNFPSGWEAMTVSPTVICRPSQREVKLPPTWINRS